MKQPERHARIVEIVSRSGFATIEELASAFDVTHQTIRRDLKVLDDSNQIQRFLNQQGWVIDYTLSDHRSYPVDS